MFNLQHFLRGREGTELISFKQVRFQKSDGYSKFTPFNMTYPVNNDDDKKNHDNNNELYTYSIVGSYIKYSTIYFIMYFMVMNLGHRQWLYKLYYLIQRRQLDSQAGLCEFVELCTSDTHD